uniref:Growth hormone receptor a n=2 Tax=Paramormyrops kingsleyae TaxID=1676925 RepID=A0A3B3TD74_9TELE
MVKVTWKAEDASSEERGFPAAQDQGSLLGWNSDFHMQTGPEMMAARHLLLLLSQACLLLETGSLAAAPPLTASEAPLESPHFTACLSREQETFRCWWSAGSFRNLSQPGALRVFFLKKNSLSRTWMECPNYTASVPNECYFNKSYTSIWTSYCLQLRSRHHNVTYDERCFNVEDIVHPDPPVSMNWTLLNVSRSGLHFDIIVRWEPPPSADVKAGWMSLTYEVQYRERNASHWEVLDLETSTQQSVYGLHTNMEYEVRVRCKMRAFDNFGQFSDSIFVHVPGKVHGKESTFPVTVVFIFGVVGLAILFLLIIFSHQQKLMVILLPPVPAPKIKGIDPDLLKKGRLDELSSVLSSHPLCKAEMYREEPWVEFIELDLERMDAAEKTGCSDTQRLLGLVPHLGSSHRLAAKDGDLGRASCYEPELSEADPAVAAAFCLRPRVTSPELQSDRPAPDAGPAPVAGSAPDGEADGRPVIQTQLSTQSSVSMDFYAQVSDVTPLGGVVLSPGQQVRGPGEKGEGGDGQPLKNQKEGQKKEGEGGVEKEVPLPLLIVAPDSGAYTSELGNRQIGSDCSRREAFQDPPAEMPQPPPEKNAVEQFALIVPPAGEYQSPYFIPPTPQLPPVADYTVVQDVDAQQSLLLNPSTPPPPSMAPVKPPPAMPVGYLTPDLLGNISL